MTYYACREYFTYIAYHAYFTYIEAAARMRSRPASCVLQEHIKTSTYRLHQTNASSSAVQKTPQKIMQQFAEIENKYAELAAKNAEYAGI